VEAGGAPVAPINSLSMLTDVIPEDFKSVPCPNRDVVYGFGMLDLSKEPVVVQVPDFGDRFWIYQVGDHRTDSFAELGSMYNTREGFYLIAGPDWDENVPDGIQCVFRSPTNLAYILPRLLVTSEIKSNLELQSHLEQVAVYPMSKYTGRFKSHNWTNRKWYPSLGCNSRERCRLVRPREFFEDLKIVLNAVPPLAGEERRYEIARRIVEASDASPSLAEYLRQLAEEIEESHIVPLFDFRNLGTPLEGHWTSTSNGAAFGVDYRTRTAIAKSNMFVNRQHEAKYYYLEHSGEGALLSGQSSYRMTFQADALPPNSGFWSLSLYDEEHRLFPNPWKRHSIGSLESRALNWNEDGSLTISIHSEPADTKLENWLPSPPGNFVLYLRVYAPGEPILNGEWIPPPAIKHSMDRYVASSSIE